MNTGRIMNKVKSEKLLTVEAAIDNGTGAGSQQLDISRQVAKASAYLNRTHSEFIQNARNAKRLLGHAESGVLAGPVLRRR